MARLIVQSTIRRRRHSQSDRCAICSLLIESNKQTIGWVRFIDGKRNSTPALLCVCVFSSLANCANYNNETSFCQWNVQIHRRMLTDRVTAHIIKFITVHFLSNKK